MKKKIIILLTILFMFCLVACGKGNSKEKDPNEGKLFLTDELQAEMENGFDSTIGDHNTGLCGNGESIKSDANSTAKIMDISVKFDSYEITSYEKIDDYNYVVNIILSGTDITNAKKELKLEYQMYFKESDNEKGYNLKLYCPELREGLRALEN